jgi:predicted DNA binding CopG/RHH family protein
MKDTKLTVRVSRDLLENVKVYSKKKYYFIRFD